LRNLCEGNPVVQAQVSELEVQKVLDSPQKRAKGIAVQVQMQIDDNWAHVNTSRALAEKRVG
jgi:hypothetical protein